MSSLSFEQPDHSEQNPTKNRWILWVILLLPLSMIVGSTLYFKAYSAQFSQQQHRVNYGDLLIEHEIKLNLPQQTVAGEFSQQWLFVWPQQQCIQCEATLQQIANVVKALGKYQSHITPAVLSGVDINRSNIPLSFPFIEDASAFSILSETFPQYEYFLIDDQGWVVLGYASEPEFKSLLKDMKRLMKRRY